MNKNISLLVAIGLLTGCTGGSHIKDVSSFEKRPLVKTSVMPSKAQISGAKARVVVLDIDDQAVAIAKTANLGVVIRNKVESLVADAGAETVDRKLAMKLQEEIQLAEVKGNRNYKGPEIADFSITGKVVTTEFTQSYSAASSWVDDKGKRHVTPAKCTYRAAIEATLKVHALPSLNLLDTISITDSESRTQDLSGHSYRHYYTSQTCPKYTQAQLSSLIGAAGADAVVESKVQIKSNFSPRGYITEYRVAKDRNIFKITMGKLAGVKEGMKVDVIQMFHDENALTGETNLEERKLTEGAVSNIVGQKYSWIVIDDASMAGRIRLGDTVKVRFEDSFLDEIKKIF
ncbi:hypothetical protein MNBD_GAMMA11-175 [hydrothermal vent metagenome]|uniref:Uncharacterized protein n=1 Tax=hydrothermal vent metagenome TaxID=652676 RepID=A0A3B0XM32_9ZZZZ